MFDAGPFGKQRMSWPRRPFGPFLPIPLAPRAAARGLPGNALRAGRGTRFGPFLPIPLAPGVAARMRVAIPLGVAARGLEVAAGYCTYSCIAVGLISVPIAT